MSDANHQTERYDGELILQIMEVVETALTIRTLSEIETKLLPSVVAAAGSRGVLAFINDPLFKKNQLFQSGCTETELQLLDGICARQIESELNTNDAEPKPVVIKSESENQSSLFIYPKSLQGNIRVMVVFLYDGDNIASQYHWRNKFANIVSTAIINSIEITQSQQQIAHLNVYMSISSLLSQTLGLHQLLETALYCCIDAMAAETASILLLNDDKTNFVFYQVEGATKQLLEKSTFSANVGIAGGVLKSQQAEIINDVQNDSRFNREVDKQSGFHTRNMLAVPLSAGEEHIGVLEIINKNGGGDFLESEKIMLVSIADEISYAIRDAKIFEYVANNYCKQRQGQNSCKGCQRPLGSWTPCVRYREVEI